MNSNPAGQTAIAFLCHELLRNNVNSLNKSSQHLNSQEQKCSDKVEERIGQLIVQLSAQPSESFGAQIGPLVKALTKKLLDEAESIEEFSNLETLPARIQQVLFKLIEHAKESSTASSSSELDQMGSEMDGDGILENQQVPLVNYSNSNNAAGSTNVCSRVFIMQVLKSMRDSMQTDRHMSTHIASIIKDKIDIWLKKAQEYCSNPAQEEADRAIFGGTVYNSQNPRTFWSDANQFLGWWKNNIERKIRLREIEQEAMRGNTLVIDASMIRSKQDELKLQRIRWCQHLVTLVREIKSHVSGQKISPFSPLPFIAPTSGSNFSSNEAVLTAGRMSIKPVRPMVAKDVTPPFANSTSLGFSQSLPPMGFSINSIKAGIEDSPFIINLYDLVSNVNEKSIQWYKDKASLFIADPVEFVCRTLPKYFRLTSGAKFLRFLSIHGFTARTDNKTQIFWHPLFVQGRRDWAELMSAGPTNAQVTAAVLQRLNLLQSQHHGPAIPQQSSEIHQAEIGEGQSVNASDNLSPAFIPTSSTPETIQTESYASMYHHLLHLGYHPLWASQLIQSMVATRSAALPPNLRPPPTPHSLNVTSQVENPAVYDTNDSEQTSKESPLAIQTMHDNDSIQQESSTSQQCKRFTYSDALRMHQNKRHYDISSYTPIAEAWSEYYASQYRLQKQLQLQQEQQQQQQQPDSETTGNNNSTREKKKSRRSSKKELPSEVGADDAMDVAEDEDNEAAESSNINSGKQSGSTSKRNGETKTKSRSNKSAVTVLSLPQDDTPVIDLRHPRRRRIFLDFTALTHNKKPVPVDQAGVKDVYCPIYGFLHGKIVQVGDSKQLYGGFVDLDDDDERRGEMHWDEELRGRMSQNDDISPDIAAKGASGAHESTGRRSQAAGRTGGSSSTSASRKSVATVKKEEESWFPKRSSRVGENYQATIPALLSHAKPVTNSRVETSVDEFPSESSWSNLPSQSGCEYYGKIWSPRYLADSEPDSVSMEKKANNDNEEGNIVASTHNEKANVVASTPSLSQQGALSGDTLTISLFQSIVEAIVSKHRLLWGGTLQFFHQYHSLQKRNSSSDSCRLLNKVLGAVAAAKNMVAWLQVGDVVVVYLRPSSTDASSVRSQRSTSSSMEEIEENDDDVSIDSSVADEDETVGTVSLCTIVRIKIPSYTWGNTLYEVYDGKNIFAVSAKAIVSVPQPAPITKDFKQQGWSDQVLKEEDLWFLLLQSQGNLRVLSRRVTSLTSCAHLLVNQSPNQFVVSNKSPSLFTRRSSGNVDSSHTTTIDGDSVIVRHNPQRWWTSDEVKQFCSAQRRFGDNVHRIWRQYFVGSGLISSGLEAREGGNSFRDVVSLFYRLHPALQRAESRQLCAVFRHAEDVWMAQNGMEEDEQEDEEEEGGGVENVPNTANDQMAEYEEKDAVGVKNEFEDSAIGTAQNSNLMSNEAIDPNHRISQRTTRQSVAHETARETMSTTSSLTMSTITDRSRNRKRHVDEAAVETNDKTARSNTWANATELLVKRQRRSSNP